MSKPNEIILAGEVSLDLTPGTKALISGFQIRYPQLPGADIHVLANTVLGEIGKHIGAGEDLAFIRKNSDGTAELTVLGLKPVGDWSRK